MHLVIALRGHKRPGPIVLTRAGLGLEGVNVRVLVIQKLHPSKGHLHRRIRTRPQILIGTPEIELHQQVLQGGDVRVLVGEPLNTLEFCGCRERAPVRLQARREFIQEGDVVAREFCRAIIEGRRDLDHRWRGNRNGRCYRRRLVGARPGQGEERAKRNRGRRSEAHLEKGALRLNVGRLRGDVRAHGGSGRGGSGDARRGGNSHGPHLGHDDTARRAHPGRRFRLFPALRTSAHGASEYTSGPPIDRTGSIRRP